MIHIEFEYRDEMSRWTWKKQSCTVSSVEECKRIYGLDRSDVDYRIVKVQEVER